MSNGKKILYLFKGNPNCGSCSPKSGYYTVLPDRPHPNCQCEIVKVKDKKCNGKISCGVKKGGGFPKDLGNGRVSYDMDVDVVQPDGSVDHGDYTIELDDDMDKEAHYDAIRDSCLDAGNDISKPCKPPLIC